MFWEFGSSVNQETEFRYQHCRNGKTIFNIRQEKTDPCIRKFNPPCALSQSLAKFRPFSILRQRTEHCEKSFKLSPTNDIFRKFSIWILFFRSWNNVWRGHCFWWPQIYSETLHTKSLLITRVIDAVHTTPPNFWTFSINSSYCPIIFQFWQLWPLTPRYFLPLHDSTVVDCLVCLFREIRALKMHFRSIWTRTGYAPDSCDT